MIKNKTLLILSLNILLIFTVMMGIFPIAPLVANDLGMSPGEIGSIAGLASLIMTFLSIPSGVFADRYGRKKLIVLSMLLSVVSMAIISVSYAKYIFIIGWLVFGFARGLLTTPSFAMVTDICKPEDRGKAMGFVSGAIGAGSVLGYVLSGLISNYCGWHLTFGVFTGLLLISMITSSTLLKETGAKNTSRKISEAFKNSFKWLGYKEILLACVIGTFCFMIGIYSTFMVPFTAEANKVSLALISFLFIPYEAVASLGSIILGWISDKVGRKVPLIISQLMCIGALILMFTLNFNPILLAISYAIIGLTEGPIITVVNTIITDKVLKTSPREVGAALGTFRTVQGVGIALGPTLAGYFYSKFGTQRSYLIGAGVLVLMVLISLCLEDTRKASSNKTSSDIQKGGAR